METEVTETVRRLRDSGRRSDALVLVALQAQLEGLRQTYAQLVTANQALRREFEVLANAHATLKAKYKAVTEPPLVRVG